MTLPQHCNMYPGFSLQPYLPPYTSPTPSHSLSSSNYLPTSHMPHSLLPPPHQTPPTIRSNFLNSSPLHQTSSTNHPLCNDNMSLPLYHSAIPEASPAPYHLSQLTSSPIETNSVPPASLALRSVNERSGKFKVPRPGWQCLSCNTRNGNSSHQHHTSALDSPVHHVGHSSLGMVAGGANYNATSLPDSIYAADRQRYFPSGYTRLGTHNRMYCNHQPISVQPTTANSSNTTANCTVADTSTVNCNVGSTIHAATNSTVSLTNDSTTSNVCSTNSTVPTTSDSSSTPLDPDQCVRRMESRYGAGSTSTDSRVSVSVRLPSLSNHSHGNNSDSHSSHDPGDGSHGQYNDQLTEDIDRILSHYYSGNESSSLPTTARDSENTVPSDHGLQLVPNPATQSNGCGLSLSVEISGDGGGGNTIDLNLDVSRIQNSSTLSPATIPRTTQIQSLNTVTTHPVASPVLISPSPPSHHHHDVTPHSSSQSTGNEAGTSGVTRDEIIIVDSSDDEDDHTVIMFTPHQHLHNRHHGSITHSRRREATQISQDERLARHLQAQFDRELDVSVNDSGSSGSQTPSDSSVLSLPLLPGYSSNHTDNPEHVGDNNLWSSRGPSGAISTLSHIPTINPPPQSNSNFHALASHIHHITPNDAHRILHAAALSGRPSMSGMSSSARRRWSRLHTASNRSFIFNAIMARHNSYEELLELAETLGPAQSRGLTREEISRLPSRAHRKKDGDDKSCVVCMSDFQLREKIRRLRPCDHEFHQKCIDKWLKEHNTCPICRVRVSVTFNLS